MTILTAGGDLAGIERFVSQVGFPIFMCIALFYYIQKRMDKLTDALNNNTTVMIKLLERMDEN